MKSAPGKGNNVPCHCRLSSTATASRRRVCGSESEPAGAGRKPRHSPEGMTADRISIPISDDDRLQLQLLREMLRCFGRKMAHNGCVTMPTRR